MGAQSNSAADDAAQVQAGIPNHSWCTNPNAAGCAQLRSDLDSENSKHTTSMILYGGAGVLAVGALASWFLLPHGGSDSPRTGALVPIVTGRELGAGYAAEF
jgi:hypothetical protein